MKRRVVKIGGSLFELPEVERLVRNWLAGQRPAQTIVIAGGGKLVDSIRDWQTRFGLDDSSCHLMSIKAMSITARVTHNWFSGSVLSGNLAEIERSTEPLIVFDCKNWMQGKKDIAESWSVTSDSIAALVAVEFEADELVLLKSKLPEVESGNLEELSRSGFVDTQFQFAAAGLPSLRIVNLRSAGKEIELLPAKNQLH